MESQQYYVARPDNTQEGPYDINSLIARYQAGKYPTNTLVWCEGMSNWVNIQQWVTENSVPSHLPPIPEQFGEKTSYNDNIHAQPEDASKPNLPPLPEQFGKLRQNTMFFSARNVSQPSPLPPQQPPRKKSKKIVYMLLVGLFLAGGMTYGIIEWQKEQARIEWQKEQARIEANTMDGQGFTPLMRAAASNNKESVLKLIKAGADVNAKNKDGWTALVIAAGKGHTEVVKALLNAHADVNAKYKNGVTALMLAADKRHTEVVKALLNAHADVNAKHKDGGTALMAAAREGHTEVVKALLNAHADVNAKNKNGETALMVAAYKRHTEVVKALLNAHADVNAKDNKIGGTALMVAAELGHTEVVKALLDAGADVNAKNKDGVTALMAAAYKRHTEVVKALRDAGAKLPQTQKQPQTQEDERFGFGDEEASDSNHTKTEDSDDSDSKANKTVLLVKSISTGNAKAGKESIANIKQAIKDAKGNDRKLLNNLSTIITDLYRFKKSTALVRQQNAKDERQIGSQRAWLSRCLTPNPLDGSTNVSGAANARNKIQMLGNAIQQRTNDHRNKLDALSDRVENLESQLRENGREEDADILSSCTSYFLQSL